jgi:cyclophilin family peptidyl-prolyl cis-trans isomerase
MNRPIHTAAAKQRGIRRVYDCVDIQTGDVTFDDGQTGHDASSHS